MSFNRFSDRRELGASALELALAASFIMIVALIAVVRVGDDGANSISNSAAQVAFSGYGGGSEATIGGGEFGRPAPDLRRFCRKQADGTMYCPTIHNLNKRHLESVFD